MNLTRHSLRSARIALDSSSCLSCQWRTFSSSYRRFAQQETPPAAAKPRLPIQDPSLADAPRSYGKSVDEFTPKPLSRPIGLPNAPRVGDNRGIDNRSWKQRRDDFVDYDKHLARREVLKHKMSTPYFREWKNMKFHKGKSFLAPPRLFKADLSLYFPNFYGQTLHTDKLLRDTTPVLEDKVSVVSLFSSQWAENQVATFASEKQNPELHQVLKSSGGVGQLVNINIEDNALKAWIIRLFMGNLRKKLGEANWGKYFLVRKEVSTEIREAVGLLNSKVGYTYLLDGQCRIRWAGSGLAEGDEKEGLVRGVRRLIEEAKTKKQQGSAPTTQTKPAQDKTAASV